LTWARGFNLTLKCIHVCNETLAAQWRPLLMSRIFHVAYSFTKANRANLVLTL